MARRASERTIKRAAADDPLLTVKEVLAILRVARSTFDLWRELGRAPECIQLPNRQLRIRQSTLEAWLADRVDTSRAF